MEEGDAFCFVGWFLFLFTLLFFPCTYRTLMCVWKIPKTLSQLWRLSVGATTQLYIHASHIVVIERVKRLSINIGRVHWPTGTIWEVFFESNFLFFSWYLLIFYLYLSSTVFCLRILLFFVHFVSTFYLLGALSKRRRNLRKVKQVSYKIECNERLECNQMEKKSNDDVDQSPTQTNKSVQRSNLHN